MRSINVLLCTLGLAILVAGCSGIATQPEQSEAEAGTKPKKSSTANTQLEREFQAAQQLLRKNKTDQAKAQLQALIEQNPRLASPHINLGNIQLGEDDPNAAERSFNAALKINPKSLPAHNQLGVALRMQGRFNEAEQAYRAAIELEPDYHLAHRNLGILYDLYLAKPELALQHYQRYQALVENKDREIEGWIIDLQRRTNAKR